MKTLQPKLRFPEFNGDWTLNKLGNEIEIISGFAFKGELFGNKGNKLVIPKNFTKFGFGNFSPGFSKYTTENCDDKYLCKDGDLLVLLTDLTQTCELLGKPLLLNGNDEQVYLNQRVIKIITSKELNKTFLMNFLLTENYHNYIVENASGSTVRHSSNKTILNTQFTRPSLEEQTRIANFLSAVDEKLNLLKEKKSLLEDYKKGIMQKIFNQELRFKDDNGEDFEDWEVKTIGESCICLDSQRKPLNGQERQLIQGVYPYWGANNIMDYIDDYIFDETIVLLAEDGGNFNEFKTRPIANLSKGKCWVNNHTHVLKGKEDVILNEFLFYSLVHKDITGFVSGGTRSKLIKSEMLKIPIDLPSIEEQTKIANFLSAIDEKIELVSHQIQDTQEYKKGLLQQMFV